MTLREQSITNISSSLAITIGLIIAVFIPATYFIVAYEYMGGAINAEMSFSAKAVASIIVNNPKSWQFEEIRLQEILERRLDHAHRDNRKIRDLQGHVIAETKEPLARPVFTFSQPIYDSGKEVASIEIERSIFPLAARTLLVGACSSGLGIIIFLIYYFFPLRTVRETYGKLQKSEGQYKLIAEKMTDIVWIADMSLQTLYITPSVQTVLGFSREELPMTVEKQMTPESLSIAMDTLATELDIEERGDGDPNRNVTLILECYHKDGSTRWLETIISGLRNEQGVLTGIHGVSRDITERKRVEDALRASEEKFVSAFKHSPGAMCISTIHEGRFIDVNDVFLDSLGYKREEVVGQTSADINLWVDRVQRDAMLQELIKAGSSVNVELQFYDKQGNIHWGLSAMSLIKITGEACILTQTMDITERKRAEEELQQSEERYRTILDEMEEGYEESDLRGNYTFVNDAFLRLFGYNRDEITGTNFRKLTADKESERKIIDTYIEIYKTGAPLKENLEWEIIRKDGVKRTCEFHATLKKDAHGVPIGFRGIGRDITDRRQAEKILRENEEHLRGITQNLPGIIFQFYAKDSGEYGVNYISEPLAEFSKIVANIDKTNLDALFPMFLSRIHEEDRDRFLSSIKAAVETETSWNFEGRITIQSDEVIWVQGLSTPTRHTDQLVFNGILLNITERKLAEEQSRQSEEKFRNIFMTTPDCISISRISDGTILDINRRFEDIVGWKREDIIGARSTEPTFNFWVKPSEREFMAGELKSGRDILHRAFEFRRRDGLIRFGIYSARSTNIDGEACIIFILQDITDRKLAEEKFYKIFMTTPNCIAITRLKDGLITDVNKGFEDIVGWKREEAIGTKSTEPPLNFWVDMSKRNFMVEELRAGRDILDCEFAFRRSDGSIRTGIYSARPINIEGEGFLIFILQDVTEHKRMERDLMLQDKMKLMSQIASGVAHEVRNPLHAIQAISEAMAIDMDKNSDYHDYLLHIKAQVTRLSHLMNDLLELGKPIQSSQFSLQLLSEVARVSMRNWLEAHPQLSRQIKVVNELPPDDLVLVDPNKIQQVIINLMENAAQHSPKDEEILLKLSKDSENYLMAKVIDKGEGMNPQYQSKVFEPFYTTRKSGTGLGLSICRNIIERHGGLIEIINNKNAPGCTAWFTLPAYNKGG